VTSSKTPAAGAPPGATDQTVAAQPERPYMIFALILFVAGFAAGLIAQNHFHHNLHRLPVLNAGVSIFALLYVFAQAIERLLVPVSWFGGGFLDGFIPGRTKITKKTVAVLRQSAVATLAAASDEAAEIPAAKSVADTKHAVEQYSANLTATTFGAASLMAMLASGYSGTFLLHSVGVHAAGWFDLLITGLAVAGGTKPLHDLISNISSSGSSKAATT
jgi:uncharacterized membrane protein